MKNINNILLPIILIMPTAGYAQTIKDYINNEWPDSRYTDHGNETITDSKTSLMWKKCAEGFTGNDCLTGTAVSVSNWKETLELAQTNATFAGHTNWRLPNIKELASLSAFDRRSPAININFFPNIPPSSNFISSTPSINNDTEAFNIWADEGYITARNRVYFGSSPNVKIRLVRNTQ